MSDNRKKNLKARSGVPLFDEKTLNNLIRDALATKDKNEVAKKYNIPLTYVYRYLRKHGPKSAPKTPSDTGTLSGQSSAGGQYRRGDGDEVQRLRQENKELYERIGRLTLEIDKLQKG